MKTKALLICSLFAAAAVNGQTLDQTVTVPAKTKVRARELPAETQTHTQAQVTTRTRAQNPAFYRRSTANNPNWNRRITTNQTTVRNQNGAYNRGQIQHFNLNNAANPRIQSARFAAGARINGADRWQGNHYSAFRSYHSQWHDRDWWRSHHNRIVVIGGGAYYWDAGWWYPAWGYDNSYSYYPYDGPIYAYNDLPPDQVIANVQSALQAEGYYQGEVDGLLGPVTRAALADYQRDHGLYATAAIDQPTLSSLGMG